MHPAPLSGGPVLFEWILTLSSVNWAAARSLQFPGGARGRCGHVDTHRDRSHPDMTLPAAICRKGLGERVIRPRPAVRPVGAQSSWGQRCVHLKRERETRSLGQRPTLPRPLAHPRQRAGHPIQVELNPCRPPRRGAVPAPPQAALRRSG